MKPRSLAILLAALSAAACSPKPQPPAGVISRERFVAANVAVRLLPDSVSQAVRDTALKKTGVSDRQLRAWVTAYSRQPETLAKTWEEIAFKVDSISGAQPRPPGDGPTPPIAVGGPPPPPIELPDSLVLRRDDSLRYRRRPPPPIRRPGEQALPRQDLHVQQ